MNNVFFSYQGWPIREIPRSELPEMVQNWAWTTGCYVEYYDPTHWQVTNPGNPCYHDYVKG